MSDERDSQSNNIPPPRRRAARTFLNLGGSVFSQVIASAANFLVVIFIGRYSGVEELGIYYLAYSFLVFAIAFQQTLISTPYTNLGSRCDTQERAVYAGHSLLLHFFLASVFLFLLLLIGTVIRLFSSSPFGPAFTALALISPFMLLREFGRRYLLTELRFIQVVVLDSAVAVLQVAGMFLLAVTNNLSVVTAFAVVGISCAVVGIFWVVQSRREFPLQRTGLHDSALRNWRYGRWLLASEIMAAARGQVVYWLVLAILGLAATGVLSACMTVVRLANPLVFGIANACEPLLARAFASGGVKRLKQTIWHISLPTFGIMSTLCLLIYFLGVQLMSLVFNWPYNEHDGILALLLVGVAVSTAGTAPAGALNVIGYPNLTFKIRALGFMATIVLALFMLPAFGLIGGAAAILISTSLVCIGRWIACSLHIPPPPLLAPETS